MMKAWKNKQTGSLHDIQTLPGPLPEGYDPEDWELVDVSEAEISALMHVANYTHSERGIKDLFTEEIAIITHNLEDFI